MKTYTLDFNYYDIDGDWVANLPSGEKIYLCNSDLNRFLPPDCKDKVVRITVSNEKPIFENLCYHGYLMTSNGFWSIYVLEQKYCFYANRGFELLCSVLTNDRQNFDIWFSINVL